MYAYICGLFYHQYSVLVDDKNAQDAESNRLTFQTTQKHNYLQQVSKYNHIIIIIIIT